MNSRLLYGFFIYGMLLLSSACSDADKEKELADLFTTASKDLVAINFPSATTEDLISIDTFVDYKIEGVRSNGIDIVPVNDDIIWSLSDGAVSTIDQSGRLSSGSVAEVVTVTARLGILSATQDVTVSAAKFDRVIKLNDTPVLANMCQAKQIKPIGSYLNDDGSEEIRPVDNTTINTITWLIRNQEDTSPSPVPSQRAVIETQNSLVELRALETGNVIIQAQARSSSSGNIVTSVDFNQTLDHNLNSLKLCLKAETDLAVCVLSSVDILENEVVSVMAVGNYQAADGSNYNQNISAYSKWGTDSTSNATITFSADRQQLNVKGNTAGTTANISAACGNIEQTVSDSAIKNGVMLDIPVTCASGNINCLRSIAAVNIKNKTLTSLTVKADGVALVDGTALVLTSRPPTIALKVTANYSDNTTLDVTADANIIYSNRSLLVVVAISGSPGEYAVLTAGDVEIQIVFQSQAFIARITIP